MISFACALTRETFSYDVAFDAEPGITALFGVSGSGKSTTIRLLAGLERADRGRITLGDTALLDTESGICVPSYRRHVGLVFQDAHLFPHLSVRANLTYGRWFTPRDERRVDFESVIGVLGIGHLLARRPTTLSGGERQRVALGRALLASPRLLLMDEPLASLDVARRHEILPFIERMRDAFGIPIIYVSHAVEEIARLADRVVKLTDGRVSAIGTPSQVLAPSSLAAAADRFATVSIITGHIEKIRPEYGVTIVRHPAGEIVVPGRIDSPSGSVRIAIRATDVTLAIGRPGNVSVRTALAGHVIRLETDDGPFALVTLELAGGDRLEVFATRLATDALGLDVGDDVLALVKAVAIDEHGIPGLRLIAQRS